MFDGNLCTWNCKPYDVKLKPNAEPYHGKPFPVLSIHELTFKQELNQLEALNVIKKFNHSQSGAPTFIIQKKNSTVCFISDLRELYKRTLRQPYPIHKIQDILLRLELFCYGTTLDLNMWYHHIEISAKSKELCTIVTYWGKYEYQQLPMGLCNSPDIFHKNMSEIFVGLDTLRVYIDELLHVTKSSWK